MLKTSNRLLSTAASSSKFLKPVPKGVNESAIWLYLSRPDIHNAFNEHLIAELTSVFRDIRKTHPKARSVVLTGEGSAFSAGADLNWMKKMATYTKEQNERDSHQLFDMFYAIKTCELPVIGRVNGPALGGGAGLVACCDFAFAKSSAVFGFTEVKLGLVPAVISPFVIEKIGVSAAARYFVTGERFSASEAKRLSLVHDCMEENELDAAVERVTAEIASSGPEAVLAAKRLVLTIPKLDLHADSTKKFVSSEIARIRVSAEGQAGLSAFLNKTKAPWVPR